MMARIIGGASFYIELSIIAFSIGLGVGAYFGWLFIREYLG